MLAMLHFSRQDEAQADMLGFYELLRAGWDPRGFVKMFAMLDKVEKASGGRRITFEGKEFAIDWSLVCGAGRPGDTTRAA